MKDRNTTRAEREAASKALGAKQHAQWKLLESFLIPKIILALNEGLYSDECYLPSGHDIIMNDKDLRSLYGKPGCELIRLLFIKWNRGGISSKGEKYKSRHRLNPVVGEELAKFLDKLTPEQRSSLTAYDLKTHLLKLGAEALVRCKDYSGNGVKFMTIDERKVWLDTQQRSIRATWAYNTLGAVQRTPDEQLEMEALR